jgi:hypothetical protein
MSEAITILVIEQTGEQANTRTQMVIGFTHPNMLRPHPLVLRQSTITERIALVSTVGGLASITVV